MKFDRLVYVHLTNEHKKQIQAAFLHRKPADLIINSTAFTAGGGNKIFLTSAQLKRLQKALDNEITQIGMNIPVKQLQDPATGFIDLLAGTNEAKVVRFEQESEPESESDSVDSTSVFSRESLDEEPITPVQSGAGISELLQQVSIVPDTNSLARKRLQPMNVKLSSSQIKKIGSGLDTSLNLTKDNLNGEHQLMLDDEQARAVQLARSRNVGLRLKLGSDQLKKSLTS